MCVLYLVVSLKSIDEICYCSASSSKQGNSTQLSIRPVGITTYFNNLHVQSEFVKKHFPYLVFILSQFIHLVNSFRKILWFLSLQQFIQDYLLRNS